MAIGPKSCRASFLRRFRIVCRKKLYFERRIYKLGPAYYGCSSPPTDCTGPKSDIRNGCPRCEYTVQRKIFEVETQKLLKRNSPGPKANAEWPLKYLLDAVNTVSRSHVMARKGYERNWSVLTARLVEIYRDEVSKMRAADAWNREQEYEAQMEAIRARRQQQRAIGGTHQITRAYDEDDGE